MKNLIKFLIPLFFSITSYAQLPVRLTPSSVDSLAAMVGESALLKEGGNTYSNRKDPVDRYVAENDGGHFTIELSHTGSGNSTGLYDFGAKYPANAGVTIPPGRTMFIEGLSIASNQDCKFMFQWGGMPALAGLGAVSSGEYIRPLIGKFIPCNITINEIYTKFNPAFFCSVREQYSAAPTTDPIKITLTFTYRMVDEDRNIDADYTILVIGTSISNGGTVTLPENLYVYKFANWLKDTKGYNVRVINRSVSSSYSTQHENRRKLPYGRYNTFGKKPDIVIYEQGANDIGNSVPTATFAANVTAMANHVKNMWPNAYFLCLSTPGYSLSLPGSHTTLQAYRAANAAAIAAFNRPKTRWVSESYAWDEVTQGATNTTDSVHPNDAGHGLIATGLINHWINNNLSLP